MKLRDYSKGLIEGLQVGGIYEGPEAESIVRRLAVDVLELKDYQFYSEQNKELTGPQIEELDRDGEKLLSGMPLQYVLGYESFCNHRFRVDPSVLIPRPETEELVKMTVETVSEGDSCGDCCDIRNVLDACTGSGCIAWSVAAAIPEVQVYGFDVSGEALNVACRQKVPFKGPRPVFLLADLMDDPPAGLPRMDVIVCNPPYVCESEKAQMRRNVLDHEPEMALFVPDSDPLGFYRGLFHWADILLEPAGKVVCEINERFGEKCAQLAKSFGYHNVNLIRDINGKDRYISADRRH